MIQSIKNFFFVSLDPGGWVTVDKPPVSLWVQAAFAKVFGFYGWSILLPESIAAVAGCLIIFHIVKRHFGSTAGLVSALVLALSPIYIVISKTNNTDSVLILFMLLGTWAMMAAGDKGKLRYLILSAVLLGIAYNAKTLAAFMILPALFLVYFFGTNLKWRTKIWHLAVAFLVLAAVSLSWSIAVDLTPESDRPYVDNSTTNSELQLAIGYNGIQRITGQNRGDAALNNAVPGGFSLPENRDDLEDRMQPPDGNFYNDSKNSQGDGQNNNESMPGNIQRDSGGGMGGMNGAPGGNSFNGGGSASFLRMFNTTLGGQDSWLLPFGLFAILALILRCIKEKDREKRLKLLRNLLMWGTSVITMVTYFSVAEFFHPYYISAMAPFLAALIGIGLVEMWKLYKEEKILWFMLPLAFIATLAVQIIMLSSYPSFARVMIPLILGLAGTASIALVLLKLIRKFHKKSACAFAWIALAGLLIAPAVWLGYSVSTNNINAQIPSAGPMESGTASNDRGFDMFNMDENQFPQLQNNKAGEESSDSKLISFLEDNNTGEKWLIAVPDAAAAEPIILATGKPVIAIGGFSGNDNTMTVEKLQELVSSGALKYFMVGGGKGGGDTSSEVTAWVEKYGKAVDSGLWSSSQSSVGFSGRMESGTLYDLSAYKESFS